MRDLNYALRGACYEIQKTLEAFFGRCEVSITEDLPRDSIEIRAEYKTPEGVKWFSHTITKDMLAYGRDIEGFLARDIPYRIVMAALDSARSKAAKAMNHFR